MCVCVGGVGVGVEGWDGEQGDKIRQIPTARVGQNCCKCIKKIPRSWNLIIQPGQ